MRASREVFDAAEDLNRQLTVLNGRLTETRRISAELLQARERQDHFREILQQQRDHRHRAADRANRRADDAEAEVARLNQVVNTLRQQHRAGEEDLLLGDHIVLDGEFEGFQPPGDVESDEDNDSATLVGSDDEAEEDDPMAVARAAASLVPGDQRDDEIVRLEEDIGRLEVEDPFQSLQASPSFPFPPSPPPPPPGIFWLEPNNFPFSEQLDCNTSRFSEALVASFGREFVVKQ